MSTTAVLPTGIKVANYFLDLSLLQAGGAVVRDGDEWLNFASLSGVLAAWTMDDVEGAFRSAEDHVKRGGWAVGLVCYDAAPAFDQAMAARRGSQPLAWFALYDEPPEPYRELLPATSSPPVELLELDMDKPEYRLRFEGLKAALERGESYQVNLTLRQRFQLSGDAVDFFASRCGVNPPPYAAFVDGGNWKVASFSPELFFERTGNELASKPMKGTVVRPPDRGRELDAARAMAADPKSIAENIMIVDMMRNDFGSVADPGSVRVPELLRVERHRGLLQMTSTVRASTRVSTLELFRRLFPLPR